MHTSAAPKQRTAALDRLSATTFDLLVIGGGITGAGIALDAATRGLSVALIEKKDFASGTSSKSTKLVHGGLRYLEQREFGLMRENLHERDLLTRVAPNLVRPIPFLWPKWAGAGAKGGLGLWVYDLLAGVRNVGRHERANAHRAGELVPGTRKGGSGYIYYDCSTDDVRLTLAVLRAARLTGAVICNYLESTQLLESSGSIVGCIATDSMSNTQITIRASDVVSATGVWADDMRIAEDASAERRLRPSRGVHVLLSQRSLPLKAALIFPSTQRRLMFAIPWRSSVIVGTTDDEYEGSLDSPRVEPEDAEMLLASLSRAFEREFTTSDVVGAYAGLRPLLADATTAATRDLSRRHAIFRGPKGLVSVTGGKLTTFRKMAEEVVDLITRRKGRFVRCVTKSVRLGAPSVEALREEMGGLTVELDLGPDVIDSLIHAYGADAPRILLLAREEGLAGPVVEDLPYLQAEVAWGMRYEMAQTPEDILSRRLRLALEDPLGGISEETISLIETEAGRRVATEIRQYEESLTNERGPAITPRQILRE